MQTLDADITRFKKENKELRQQFELLRKTHEDLKVSLNIQTIYWANLFLSDIYNVLFSPSYNITFHPCFFLLNMCFFVTSSSVFKVYCFWKLSQSGGWRIQCFETKWIICTMKIKCDLVSITSAGIPEYLAVDLQGLQNCR